ADAVIRAMLGTLQQLAERVGGRVAGDGTVPVESVSSIDEATPDTMTFATDRQYFARALESAACAVLIQEDLRIDGNPSKPLLVVPHVRAALAALLALLRPPRPKGPFCHPSAIVEEGVHIGDDVYIAANAYVGANAKLHRACVIGVGAYVGA